MSNQFISAFVLNSYLPKCWRKHWPSVVVLLITSFATAVIAQPQAESLSLQNALHLAEQRSQALLAQDASSKASQELAIEAGQLPDPMLELSVNNLPVNGRMAYSLTEDFMTSRNIGISQTFTREAKRHARANVFELKAEKAQIAKAL
ncbi:MAG TPA: hypothetical protein VK999_06085, partial [Methylotenera sp.]|nr:hypothetical protein [Methylotenera sp.]